MSSGVGAIAASIALTAMTVAAQTSKPATSAFDVASIKTSTPFLQALADGSLIGMRVSAGRVMLGHVDLNRLIQIAYGVKKYQVVGPDWLMNPPDPTTATLFDIEATLPGGATADQVPAMLQALLADRFKLAIRGGSREYDTYGLVVAKGGVKFKEKQSVGEPDSVPTREFGVTASQGPTREATVTVGTTRMTMLPSGTTQIEASTIQGLVDYLSTRLSLPVIDKTGLTGNFDIKMEIPPTDLRSLLAGSPGAGPPDPAAIREVGAEAVRTTVDRLGLKLEPQKNPIKTIVVEHLKRTPTEN